MISMPHCTDLSSWSAADTKSFFDSSFPVGSLVLSSCSLALTSRAHASPALCIQLGIQSAAFGDSAAQRIAERREPRATGPVAKCPPRRLAPSRPASPCSGSQSRTLAATWPDLCRPLSSSVAAARQSSHSASSRQTRCSSRSSWALVASAPPPPGAPTRTRRLARRDTRRADDRCAAARAERRLGAVCCSHSARLSCCSLSAS